MQAVRFFLITFPLTSCITHIIVCSTIKTKQLLPAFAGKYLVVFKIEIGNALPVFWRLVGFVRYNTITIAIREGKLRGPGRPKRLIPALIGQLFDTRVDNVLNILEALRNAVPPHRTKSPVVRGAAFLVAVREIVYAHKFTKRVLSLITALFCMLKRIVISHFDVKTTLGVARISFETVINIIAATIYISIGIG